MQSDRQKKLKGLMDSKDIYGALGHGQGRYYSLVVLFWETVCLLLTIKLTEKWQIFTFRGAPFTRASGRAREKEIMELNRDIMKSINKVAHLLAQKQYAKHRDFLTAECKAMLVKGKTRTDINAYLIDVGATKRSYIELNPSR